MASETCASGRQRQQSSDDNIVVMLTPEKLRVILRTAKIANEQVDAIVNTPGRKLHLDCGAVSRSLVKAGGAILKKECDEAAPNGVNFGEVVVTSGGSLRCNHVLHGACCDWSLGETNAIKVLKKLVSNCFLEVNKLNLSSIAFPPIGTGGRKFPPDVVASIMLEEVMQYSRSRHRTALTDVRFVVHPQDHSTIKAFREHLEKGWPGSHSPLKPQMRTSLSLHKSSIVNEQVDVLVSTPGRKLDLSSGTITSSLLQAAGKVLQDECRQKAPGGIQFGETVTTSGGRLQCQVVVHGACCNWSKGADKCKKVLRKIVTSALLYAHSKNLVSVAFPPIGTGQRSFPPRIVAAVMLDALKTFCCLQPYTSVTDVRFVVHPIDHKTVQAFEDILQKEWPGLKIKSSDLPTLTGNTCGTLHTATGCLIPCKSVKLMEHSDEYQSVKTNMLCTGNGKVKRIHQIEKIENAALKAKYTVDKMMLQARCNSSTIVERCLWHGTSENAVKNINRDGFNRSYCGKNATAFGEGVYFAVNSHCSYNYAKPGTDGKRRMYRARVLTGDFTLGSPQYRVTPDIPNKPDSQFDSVVNNLANPQLFVIFLDSRAYPEYLITFE